MITTNSTQAQKDAMKQDHVQFYMEEGLKYTRRFQENVEGLRAKDMAKLYLKMALKFHWS